MRGMNIRCYLGNPLVNLHKIPTIKVDVGALEVATETDGAVETVVVDMHRHKMEDTQLPTNYPTNPTTKLTDGIYTRGSAGYSVVATDAPSRHRGGVAIFYCSEPHFTVKAVEKFGPNVIIFQLVTGARRWYIVGVYLAPDNTETMERVTKAIRSRPRRAELLVAGDFNEDLATPEGDRRAEDIATTLAMEGLEDMARHFLPRESRWCRYRRTWGMLRKGREVRSRTDYILGTDSRLLRNVSVRDPRHNSDHYMVLGCLPSAPPDGAQEILGREEAVAGEATAGTNTDRSTFRGSIESRTEGATARGETKRLDLGVDVETHRRESLRTPGPAIRSGLQTTTGKGGTKEPGDRKETAGGRSGGGGGSFGEGGPDPHTGGVVPPSGVIQGGSGPRSAASSSYAQADNGGAGHAIQPGPTPGRQHPCRN